MMKYEANWESLKNYSVPNWFMDDKLGIFIHWGIYAVPAYGNEWYPRNMYLEGSLEYKHHQKIWGDQSHFGYKDFISMFKAENWDPDSWVDLFKKSGARYIIPVAEHHDGFPMYNCSFTNWNAAQMGPKRDIIAELESSVREAGLKFGLSTHRAFNYHYFTFSERYDNYHPEFHKLYGVPHPTEAPVTYEFILDWYARTRELVDRFSPDLLWFDFGWHRSEFHPWHPRILAYYYNHGIEHGYEPVLQYKDVLPDNVAVYDVERGKLDDIRRHYWQTDTSISYKSWGYIEDDEFKSATSIIHDLVDIVSKNGNLLLNVGPKPDGTIPTGAIKVLQDLGSWLDVNGEAIFGTRHWLTYGEGPTGTPRSFQEKEQDAYTSKDIRFTQKDDALYAICLGWPGKQIKINTLHSNSPINGKKIVKVSMLGSDQQLSWSQDGTGLSIQTPTHKSGDHAYTFKIILTKV